MDPDEQVCLCFRVSLRKIRTYLKVNEPKVPSALCECLDAGTGCGWCVPFLKSLHEQHVSGETPDLPISPQEYASRRASYRRDGRRSDETLADGDDQSES
jgi:NAD(P)H-nitrite reductase large subunit